MSGTVGASAYLSCHAYEPVHTKNSIRPTESMIWRGKVMDLTRCVDRKLPIKARVRTAIELGYIGQVSKVGVHYARTVDPLLGLLGRDKGEIRSPRTG